MNEHTELIPMESAGTMALAIMPEAEFEQRLKVLRIGQERISQVKRELMKEDVHYGTIPGTPKPTLYQPGAQILCQIYSLRPDFKPEIWLGDGITAPHLRVWVRCELHLGDLGGPVIAVGLGAANSWERKHRYRRGERSCPSCGAVGSIIKGKAEYGGGWLCFAKKGGCGAKFKEEDAAIIGQVVGDIDNPDPFDLENTLMKMSEKRAFVNAALIGTASSDLFTQDAEDMPPQAAAQPAAPATTTTAEAKRAPDIDVEASGQACIELKEKMILAREQEDGAALEAIGAYLAKNGHLLATNDLTILRAEYKRNMDLLRKAMKK